MIDVFEIGASLNVHGNSMDFMRAFSGMLAGAHNQLDALEKKLGATKGAMKDLFVGAGEVFAGVELLKGVKDLAEAGKELNHQQSMLMRNGVSQRDVMRETASIYKDMLTAVPTASAVDFLRTLGELKTVKGSIAGAREALTQSLKIEGLIGNSTGKSAEGQGYDFWRAVEDKGIIQNKAKTDAMLNRMVQGTIATGGKIGGNDWFTYARRAGSAWIGDDIDALPLQLMEMQTLGASGAGVARRAFANRTEGAIKLTKAQMAGWQQIGMLEPGGRIKDSALEQSRPDLFIGEVIEALKAHGLDTEAKVKAWSAHALHGKDADYFMTAYAGMSEVDPESGLTRLQKERRNMGEAQPLDKAYATMMGTDFEANMEAFQKQWKSFTEALGGPAAKAMIPVLQDLTGIVTKMAGFADRHKDLTQLGVDIAGIGGALLVLGGGVTMTRGLLRFAGGGLLGMGRRALGSDGSATALKGSATALDESALALKEAAAELRAKSGMPTTQGPVVNEIEKGAGVAAVTAGGIIARALPPIALTIAAIEAGKWDERLKAETARTWGSPAAQVLPDMDQQTWWQFARGALPPTYTTPGAYSREARARARSAVTDFRGNALHENDIGVFNQPVADPATLRKALGIPDGVKIFDGNALHKGDVDHFTMNGQNFGELADKSGVLKVSFDGLDKGAVGLNDDFKTLGTGSGSLDNVFRILEATGLGAARAMAQVAMSGGMGGGGGFIQASYGGGGGGFGSGAGGSFGGAGFGGASPNLAGGDRGSGEEADFIRSYTSSIGGDPRVAMAVANAEGFGVPWGSGIDHGTSFGAFQLHIGGGLGDLFRRQTGLDPRDRANWKAMDKFAIDYAKANGWGSWHGARKIGVTGRYGFGGAGAAGGAYAGQVRGMLKIGDETFAYGSGGASGSAHVPWGDYPINPDSSEPWGRAHDAMDVNGNGSMWDPNLGRLRTGIEMHAAHTAAMITHGCLGFIASEYPRLKARVKEMVAKTGHAYLHVGPDGASITPSRVPTAGPPPSKTITPGRPAGKQNDITARLQPIHTHVHIGDHEVAQIVTNHIVAAAEHPTAIGGPDTYGSHQGPGTPLNDAA